MKPLAAPAIEVVKSGQVRMVPERFTGIYLHWMENILDWCISRQLWWGHRIPIWYCEDCGEVTATDLEVLTACGNCGSGRIQQDPDVLDTWFSSGLWTFSTLGWPDQTPDLEYFYPGHVMETGYDIIFHWVARMIFFGIEFMGEAPFRDVYLHGTVRDADGQRMSKTKGNVLDPTLVSNEYGSDALRFALITASGPGNDLKMSNERVESMRNFANKLFNATKFALRAIEGAEIQRGADGVPLMPDVDALAVADAWIIDRLHRTIAEVTRQVDEYQLHEAGRSLYEFIWSEFCDWYIEAAKVRLYAEMPDPVVPQTLAYVLERTLRLLHPFMPFVTEELWQHLPHPGEALIVAPWPVPGGRFEAEAAAFDMIAEAVRLIRNARAEQGVDTARRIPAIVYPGPAMSAFESLRDELVSLARLDADGLEYRIGEPEAQDGSVAIVSGASSIFLPLKGMIDIDAERARITREIEQVEGEIDRATAMLSNEQFVSRAPAQVVVGPRSKLASAQERLALLQARLADLG
jgi:valyl-tRNA synthetase